jgi:hypothetical protein
MKITRIQFSWYKLYKDYDSKVNWPSITVICNKYTYPFIHLYYKFINILIFSHGPRPKTGIVIVDDKLNSGKLNQVPL